MIEILNTRTPDALRITMPISKPKAKGKKIGIFHAMALIMHGMQKNTLSSMKDVQFAALQIRILVAVLCMSIIFTMQVAVNQAKRVISAVVVCYAAVAIMLSNALIPLQIGQKRLSPILGGTHE